MSEPTATPTEDRRPRLPRARWLVLGLLVLFFAVWAPIFFADGDPPDDADLRIPPPRPVPDAQNSAVAWTKAPKFESPPPDGPSWLSYPLGGGWVREGAADPNRGRPERNDPIAPIRTWVEENRTAIDARAAALDRPSFVPDPGRGIPHDLLVSFQGFDRAAFIAAIDGDLAEAWRWAEVAAEWHRRWFSHPLPAFPFILTNQPHQISIARLRLAQELPDLVFLLESALASTERSELPDGWRQMLVRRNYMAYVDTVGADEAQWATLMSRRMPPPGWAKTFHRPHRAQRLFADLTRALLDLLDRGVTDTFALEEELAGFPDVESPFERMLHFVTGNAGGVYLARRYLSVPHEMVDRPQVETIDFCAAASRTLLALRVHRARHGEWPATLEALVPDVIPVLPIDPDSPTREPLRYDPERAVIWGVGENGVDDGGVIDVVREKQLVLEGDDRVVPLVPPRE